MNKQEALKKIEELKKFIEKEDKVDVYDPNWRAEVGEANYAVTISGRIKLNTETGCDICDYNYDTGNHFKTEELAKRIGLKEYEKTKAIMRVKRYIYENFGEFVPDWENSDQKKWHIEYNHGMNGFVSDDDNVYQVMSDIGHFKYFSDTDQVVKACEDDLRIIFDVTK